MYIWLWFEFCWAPVMTGSCGFHKLVKTCKTVFICSGLREPWTALKTNQWYSYHSPRGSEWYMKMKKTTGYCLPYNINDGVWKSRKTRQSLKRCETLTDFSYCYLPDHSIRDDWHDYSSLCTFCSTPTSLLSYYFPCFLLSFKKFVVPLIPFYCFFLFFFYHFPNYYFIKLHWLPTLMSQI